MPELLPFLPAEDDLSGDVTMLPFFGGLGCVLFFIISIVTYCQHRSIMQLGVPMRVVEIGACRDHDCPIKVQSITNASDVLERSTGSKIFIGDIVKCGSERCYKD